MFGAMLSSAFLSLSLSLKIVYPLSIAMFRILVEL